VNLGPLTSRAKRKPLNRGLTLLSFQGDEALVSFPRPPRLGEALLLREGPGNSSSKWCGPKPKERGWVARAKVRGPWDGILPGWDAEIFPTSPPIPETPGPKIFLGRTLEGEEFSPGGRALEKVNVIVGAKGSGKSHLAKVILLGLIRAGAPCLVLDVNREYGGLPGVRTYSVGRNFKLGVREIGVEALSVMLEAFGTPATSLLYFETRLSKLFQEKQEFIGIDELISMAEEGEFYPTQSGYAADAVNRTLRSRLEALKLTGMVASSPLEASSFTGVWKEIREGGGSGVRSFRAFYPSEDGVCPGAFAVPLCPCRGGRKSSVRVFRGGAPLCDPTGDRCPRDKGKTHRDHEFFHHEYTHGASGRGVKGGG